MRYNYKHGMSGDRFYHIWEGMINRCKNKNGKYIKNGIKICEEWCVFINFKKQMYGDYLSHVKKYGEMDTTIDRIDNNDNYYKKNCRWATRKEQQNNTKKNIIISYKGKNKTLAEWSEETGIRYATLKSRVFIRKWNIEKSLTAKVKNGKIIEYDGKKMTAYKWAKELGIKPTRLYQRIHKYNWPIEKAFNRK